MPHPISRRALALASLLALAAGPALAAEPATATLPATQPQAATAPEAAQLPATPPPPAAAPDTGNLERVRAEEIGTNRDALASQERINGLDEETQKLLSEYRKALTDAESHAAYAVQLETQIQSQNEELASIQAQLDEVENTSRSITPLLQRMLATLHQFVALDVPFLVEERTRRVRTLEDMMKRADVSISEKYRRIIEAYQVEMDYGRTIEAYEARLAAGEAGAASAADAAGEGESAKTDAAAAARVTGTAGAAGQGASAEADADARTAKFLRVGRVSLLYQTLDGAETGYWDVEKRKWVVDNEYAHAFKEGVGVAMKLRAPEMLHVPVPAPSEARS